MLYTLHFKLENMGTIKLKICGMRDADNISQVASLLPDYMGFIFYQRSPRYVGQNFELPKDFPSVIKRVGVFVNESIEEIKMQAYRLELDFIQLHGNETGEQCVKLKNTGHRIIKVFSVDESFDFKITKTYEAIADFFLFDTKGKYYGGNATVFNWDILHRYDQNKPFFLSGGLSPANIHQIVQLKDMNLHAVDINSGVEDSPGLKNSDAVKKSMEFIQSISEL